VALLNHHIELNKLSRGYSFVGHKLRDHTLDDVMQVESCKGVVHHVDHRQSRRYVQYN
jgi:hypothetical protein